MKIVKFNDGTYGIKKGWWIFTSFNSENCSNFWYSDACDIKRYCRFYNLDAAKERLSFLHLPKWEEIE